MWKQAVRVATWVKDNYAAEKFEATFQALVSGYWGKGINVSTTEGIMRALDGIFTSVELEEILKNAVKPENKKRVIEQTMSAGAFGAPWIVALDSEGRRKSWFGNDRWDQVFEHLGVPNRPVSIIPPSSKL
jgi:glutathione S-transferase kappa 1